MHVASSLLQPAAQSARPARWHCFTLFLALLSLSGGAAQCVTATERSSATRQPDAASPAAVLSKQYLNTIWTTEEGLPQNNVNALLQTRDGYLWLALSGGLARFDGLNFTHFTLLNTPGLKGSQVRALAEDRDGALWIATDDGGVSQYAQGVFRAWTTKEGLPANRVEALARARDGGVWIGTMNGLARWRQGRLETIPLPVPSSVWSLYEDPRGNLWIGTQRGLIRAAQGSFQVYTTKDGLPHDWVQSLCETRDGKLWIGCADVAGGGGLAWFANGVITPCKLPFKLRLGVQAISEDQTGNVWIGTWTDGFFCFRQGELVHLTARDGLSSDRVVSILADREGNLWFGTEGGLNRWRKKRVGSLTTADGLATNLSYLLFEDSRGAHWVGSSCEGVTRRQNGQLTRWRTKEDLQGGCVHALGEDAAGSIWIGTTKGLAQLVGERFVYRVPGTFPNMCVHALYRDPAGTFWVGEDRGLHRINADGGTTAWRTSDGLVESEGLKFITSDKQGALWIGTTGGLSRFKDGRFTNYTTAQGLSHNHIRAILVDVDGTLWLGTFGGGLNRFKDGRFVPITKRHGLLGDIVSRILDDERGNLWLGTNRGVARVSKQELNDFADGKLSSITCANFGVADGMPVSETRGGVQPAGWRMRDGRLWFPTDKGIAVFDPAAPNDPPPPVYLEQITLNGQSQPAAARLQIESGKENLELHYTGLNFSRPDQVKFKYQLAGLDHGWIDAGTRRTAFYPHLPPGAYTFRVIAANGDGVWNMEGARLAIVVQAPFYRRWWFLALSLAGVSGLALLGYKLRVRQLERARAEQEEFARRLINAHEGERQRIAGELHDGLSQSLAIIRQRATICLQTANDHERKQEQLEEIAEAATAVIDEVREIIYDLRPVQLDRLGLTKSLEEMLDKVARAHGLTIQHELDDLDGRLSKEAESSLYRIVQEGVNNIVRHAQASRAAVRLKQEAEAICLVIEDNGRGFTPEVTRNGIVGSGLGLTGIRERTHLLGGEQLIESAPSEGTTITIRLPLRREKNDEH